MSVNGYMIAFLSFRARRLREDLCAIARFWRDESPFSRCEGQKQISPREERSEGQISRFARNDKCIASVVVLFALTLLPLSIRAQTLRVAAASDLQFVLPELAAQYEKQSGVKLAVTYGSSGNFFAQIQNGAPFDLFFSADSMFPNKLAGTHLAEADSLQVYAMGRVVLWLPGDSPLDPAGGLKILLDPRIQKIAIANPEHAPYGRAAVSALEQAGLYGRLKSKLVLGENISQAAQFVQSGSAQAGLIALSLALSPAMASGKRWDLPTEQQPELEQAVVLLTSSPNKKAAADFLVFLKTPQAHATFERYGFLLPPPHAPGRHKL